jgi:ketosteroid isomerase-like protein
MGNSGDEAGVRAAEARFYDALRRVHEDGPAALLATWSRGDDVTTMNAAGGYERGQGEVRGRWSWWAGRGVPMPATRIEHLACAVGADLAYTVALEHHGERVLRVTHVYRREDGDWKLVHRHADPLATKPE